MSSPRNRRQAIGLGIGGAFTGVAFAVAARPVAALPEGSAAAIKAFAGDAAITPGRIAIDLPPLVENGNSAPLGVMVESPMTSSDYVRRIAVFSERNPEREIIGAQLGPRSGRAALTTRIKLNGSQTLTAVAEMSDGTYWSATADVIVTLAACVEG